jgi:hypothetical protein
MNLTALFLGDPQRWPGAQIALVSIHTLWGGQIISVAGTGAAAVRLVERGLTYERAYSIQLGPVHGHALLRLCVEHDLLAADPPERAFLIPDETHTELRLSCGRRSFAVLRWEHDPPCPAFGAVSEALLALLPQAAAAAPLYEGPYRPPA